MSNIKKDCYAWNERRHLCDVLDEIVCSHKTCSFYTEKDKYKLKQAQAEINKLEHERIKATKTKNEMAQVFEHDDNLYKFKKL